LPEGLAESLWLTGITSRPMLAPLPDTPMALTGIRLRSGGFAQDTDRLAIPQVAVL